MDESAWVDLPPVYQAAARTVVAEYASRAEVRAILLAGSVLRGEGGPTSDLDFWILADLPYRQRRSFLVGGVPVEVFLNSPARVEGYLQEGDAHAMHMAGTGRLVYVRPDAADATADLQARASALFARGPAPWGPQTVAQARYSVIDALLDVEDILAIDPDGATLVMHRALDAVLALYYGRAGVWPPKGKRLLADLTARAPALAAAVRACLAVPDAASRYAALRAVFALVLPAGSDLAAWCWESAREPVE